MRTAAGILIVLLCVTFTSSVLEAQTNDSVVGLANGGFEALGETPGIPINWFQFSSKFLACGLDETVKRSGDRSMKFWAQNAALAHVGLAQDIPVTAGTRYTFRVFVLNSSKEPIGKDSFGNLGIEWKDESRKELSRVEGIRWTRTASRLRWEVYEVTGTAPDNSVAAAFVIHFSDGEQAGSGCCYVDDAQIIAK